ncbi:MAG: glycosyltransferase family A protein [Candidatus Magasanikbacteria bacterium]
MNEQSYSIIIPTYNRVEKLKICLDSVLTYSPKEVDVFVINDGSSGETKKYLNILKNDRVHPIHHETNKGVSKARNTGITHANGDILLFTDDDCVVSKDWFEELTRPFTNKDVSFVFGKTTYVSDTYVGYFPEKIVEVRQWPGAGNIAFRKEVFDKVGGFDSAFETYHNEDTEMAVRAVSNNFLWKYTDSATCYHQKSFWSAKTLLASAKNPSVWPVLKKLYPKCYLTFGGPVRRQVILPRDYLFFLFFPLFLPFLLLRYLCLSKRNLKLFFLKWPIVLFLRRYYIWKESLKNRTTLF